jgi:hypothetical protein
MLHELNDETKGVILHAMDVYLLYACERLLALPNWLLINT